jgi:WD40 repeat protein
VLVIDQFEELFTLVQDEQVRADFIDSLFSAVAEPRSRLWVVITLRADFYDRPLMYLPSSELLSKRTEIVGPLTPGEMYRAITGPAERVGLELERDLVATIMQDIAEQPGTLPLLQYALTELYERREGRMLTLSAYRTSGGVFGSLALRAESLYGGLTGREQESARQLFLRLVTLGDGVEDTRRRVLMSELVSVVQAGANEDNNAREGALHRVLDLFGRYRMLTFDRNPLTREPTVEVAHEALLRTWGRLRGWLDESRENLHVQRRLMASAAEWLASGQQPSYLTSGSRLAQFEGLAAHTGDSGGVELTGEEQAFLKASQEGARKQADAEEQRQTRELALQQDAQANFIRAEAQRLAAEATTRLQTGPFNETLALLSIRSIRTQYSPQADAALAEASIRQYPKQRYTGHTRQLNRVTFSPDGKYIVTGGWDTIARLYDIQSGEEVRQFAHPSVIGVMTFSRDSTYLLSGSSGVVMLWDVQAGQQVRQFVGHTDWAVGKDLSPDCKYVLSGGNDRTVRLWDAQSGEELRRFLGHTGPVWDVHFSPDGKRALSTGGLGDCTARLWDIETGQLLGIFKGHTDALYRAAFSPDGKRVLTSSHDKIARLWETETQREVRQFIGHTEAVNSVAFSPDEKYVLTGSWDSTARLWDTESGREVRRFAGHNGTVNDSAYSPDGKYVLTGGGNDVLLWEVSPPAVLPRLTGHALGVWNATYLPGGGRVLTSDGGGTLRLWDSRTGDELLRVNGCGSTVANPYCAVAVSPDGNYLLTTNFDGVVKLRDALTGDELRQFVEESAPTVRVGIEHVVFAPPDGRYALTAHDNGKLLIWDVQSGKDVQELSGHSSQINDVAFSPPDGRYVLSADAEGTVRLWDAQRGNEVQQLSGHEGQVWGVAFSPDGKKALTGGADAMVRLWDVETGKELAQFKGHGEAVNCLTFSPAGRHVLTGSNDKTARLWDVETQRELRRFAGHTHAVSVVAFSPDGEHVLTGSEESARIWNTDYNDTIRDLCGRLIRDFTDAERVQFGISDKELTCPKP